MRSAGGVRNLLGEDAREELPVRFVVLDHVLPRPMVAEPLDRRVDGSAVRRVGQHGVHDLRDGGPNVLGVGRADGQYNTVE